MSRLAISRHAHFDRNFRFTANVTLEYYHCRILRQYDQCKQLRSSILPLGILVLLCPDTRLTFLGYRAIEERFPNSPVCAEYGNGGRLEIMFHHPTSSCARDVYLRLAVGGPWISPRSPTMPLLLSSKLEFLSIVCKYPRGISLVSLSCSSSSSHRLYVRNPCFQILSRDSRFGLRRRALNHVKCRA